MTTTSVPGSTTGPSITDSSSGSVGAYALLFAALILHGLWFWVFNSPASSSVGGFIAILLANVFLIMLAIWHYGGDIQKSGLFWGMGAAYVLLPYLFSASWFPRDLGNYLLWFLTVIPLWVTYIIMEDPGISRRLRIVYIFILLLLGIVLFAALIGSLLGSDLFPELTTPGVILTRAVQDTWQNIVDNVSQTWERIKDAFRPGDWKNAINRTFNPQAQFYVGQVEQNQREPTGVFLRDVRSLYPETPLGTDPVVLGRLEAVTFLDKPLLVALGCRLERGGRGVGAGIPDPVEPVDLNKGLYRDAECLFTLPENTTRGSYQGIMSAEFDYETWSYITNTFMGRSEIERYYRQGRDLHRDLDIPRYVQAIYTNGPVEIGVRADQQPIDIDPEAPDGRYIQQRFGFTVANRWHQGRVDDVYEVEVLLPPPFELEPGSCLPQQYTGTETVDGMTKYIFTKDVDLDPRLDYSTITCKLRIPTARDAQAVVDFGKKTPVTFVVVAKYKYVLEAKATIRVIE